MSQLTDRLERDLRELAAGAHPSPSAWESIVARLGDDGESEVALVLAPDPDRSKRPLWNAVAAAALIVAIAGSIAVLTGPGDDQISTADPDATTPSVAPPSTATDVVPTTTAPFVGNWVSTDTDGSSQTMEIVGSGGADYEFVLRDDFATACSGAPATMTGTGRLETDEGLVIAQPELTCDDGTVPGIGPPPQADLANLTFELDTATDELVDSLGVAWRRAAEGPTLTMGSTFVSPSNGFSFKYPRGAPAPAEEPWDPVTHPAIDDHSGGPYDDAFDVVETGYAAVLKGASTEIPDGVSIDEWVDEYVSPGGCGELSDQAEISIDGQSGRISECPDQIRATVVAGGRLYLFTLLHARSDARAFFDAFAATIDLTPETAAAP